MNRRVSKRGMALAVVVGMALVASPASADWGDGVRGGAFVLHPGLSLSAGFDSNVYHASSDEVGRLQQAPELQLEPSLSFSHAEDGLWQLSGEASVTWRQFLTDDDRVRNQSGLAANADVNSVWNSDGTASLELSNDFTRTNETPSQRLSENSNRIFNRSGARVGLHPGAGILESYASYDFSFYRHNLYEDLDRHTHRLGWDGRWSFLPKTSLSLGVDYRMIRYDEPFRGDASVVNPEGRLRNVDSNPLRIRGGLEGQFTPRISARLRSGYGWSRYEEGPNHSGFLVDGQASYQFGNVDYDNRLRVGYRMDFSDSTVGNYYTTHRGLAGYEQGFVNNRLRLDLEASVQVRNYAETGVQSAQTPNADVVFPDELSDLLVGLNARTRYEIRRGWSVSARYGFSANLTDDEIIVDGPGEDSIRDYQRHHVLVSTSLRY